MTARAAIWRATAVTIGLTWTVAALGWGGLLAVGIAWCLWREGDQ